MNDARRWRRPDGPVGISILGSTGSVGRQTLEVLDRLPDRFRVVALAARRASPAFLDQVERYRPTLAAASEPPSGGDRSVRGLVTGADALTAAATHPDAAIVVVASSGHAAILPTYHAISAGKTIALANKETIVCAGELIVPHADRHAVPLRPVDSEHSALWQAMAGAPVGLVERLILTASGGPFRTLPADALARVTVDQALAHPTWSMGDKLTVDSATLMNKGLEIIEARWLFGVPLDRIDVLVHPESIVHSIVEFVDGGQIAQLSIPDMRLPIQLALTYPERLPSPCRRLSLADSGPLHFELPDRTRFPALGIARQAGAMGNTYPTVLSAADDVAVEAFLGGRLRFLAIPALVARVLDRHRADGPLTFASIEAADAWARSEAGQAISEC